MRVAVALLSLALSSAAFAKNLEIKAPAGEYKIDPNHNSLVARVLHLGLAPYAVRMTRIDATLKLDPAKIGNSSLAMTIDPTSIDTDFAGDYVATHQGTPYKSFEEALAQGDKMLNAGKFPAITFKSTSVKPGAGPQSLKVTGDLGFLGQTHPVTLDVTVTGSTGQHPFTKKGAIGFSATGKFTRSQWGMTGTQQFLGDEVSLAFDGEFHQQ
jgi:polyisoprenoid-binding protein YceI